MSIPTAADFANKITDVREGPYLPMVLPADTYKVKLPGWPRSAFQRSDGLKVLVTVARFHEDGRLWMHVSCSRTDRAAAAARAA